MKRESIVNLSPFNIVLIHVNKMTDFSNSFGKLSNSQLYD